MKDNLDKKIKEAFIKKIDKPLEYENIIKNALNKEENTNKFKILKLVACFLLVTILISSVLFSKNILAFINYLLRNDSRDGIKEAIDNGYIQEVKMKYINSNGTNVKVSEILMDDYNLSIIFDIEIPEIENIEELYNINLPNLIITDDENKFIVAEFEGPEKYEKFCKENNIEKSYNNIAYSNGGYEGKIVTKYDKTIEYMYTTYSDNFPKSKKLYISFDKIILENNKTAEQTTVEGDWNLEVNLSEEIYNREKTVYRVKNCTRDDLIVTKAEVSSTAMKIEWITRWGDPVYSENDSEEEKQRKTEEFFNNTHSVRNILIQNEYVENSEGKRFYPVINSSDGNGGYNQMLNGMFRHWQTFNLTKYKATDSLKVVFEFNDEKIIIELENKK